MILDAFPCMVDKFLLLEAVFTLVLEGISAFAIVCFIRKVEKASNEIKLLKKQVQLSLKQDLDQEEQYNKEKKFNELDNATYNSVDELIPCTRGAYQIGPNGSPSLPNTVC